LASNLRTPRGADRARDRLAAAHDLAVTMSVLLQD